VAKTFGGEGTRQFSLRIKFCTVRGTAEMGSKKKPKLKVSRASSEDAISAKYRHYKLGLSLKEHAI